MFTRCRNDHFSTGHSIIRILKVHFKMVGRRTNIHNTRIVLPFRAVGIICTWPYASMCGMYDGRSYKAAAAATAIAAIKSICIIITQTHTNTFLTWIWDSLRSSIITNVRIKFVVHIYISIYRVLPYRHATPSSLDICWCLLLYTDDLGFSIVQNDQRCHARCNVLINFSVWLFQLSTASSSPSLGVVVVLCFFFFFIQSSCCALSTFET